ncbi:DMT family transporter [Actinomadura formosensis]|uniref:DMT family transporter n=1 Tax=Actinomadura formosensis TaxID=60706 RepID=UPI0008295975|nr:DMT family transporter [Actinomadura formosensis]
MNVLAVAIALAAAVLFVLAAALQHHAAFHEVRHGLFDVRLLWRLLHHPIWIGGQLTDLVGIALHATALQIGALVLVQPIQVSGLPLSVPMEAALNRRRPHRRELGGAALATAGLAAFLVAAAPEGGIKHPSGVAWFASGGLVAVTVIGLLALSHHTTGGSRSGASVGLATGVLYGFTAALLKTCTNILATRPLTLPLHWEVYVLIGAGIVGMQLNQSAFQHSSLASPLTAMTLGEPLVSVIIGLTAFHERIRTSPPRLAIIFVAALAMAYGIWTTSTTWQPPARRPAAVPPDDQADR